MSDIATTFGYGLLVLGGLSLLCVALLCTSMIVWRTVREALHWQTFISEYKQFKQWKQEQDDE